MTELPEVEEAILAIHPNDYLNNLLAQAAEIERLEDYAEGLKLGASIVREERDRYKRMAEWLAEGANECRDCKHYQIFPSCHGCNRASKDTWLKVAAERTRDE